MAPVRISNRCSNDDIEGSSKSNEVEAYPRLTRAHNSTFQVGRRKRNNRFSAVADAVRISTAGVVEIADTSHIEKEAAISAAARRDEASEGPGAQGQASADAIEAFGVVAALVFGFSGSSLVAVACELNAELVAGRTSIAVFCLVAGLAAALSGYATVFFTLEVYYLKRLSDEAGSARSLMIESFMTFTGKWLRIARISTNSALAADLVAIALLLWDFLPTPFAVAMASTLGCGAALVWFTMRNMKLLASACFMEAAIHDASLYNSEHGSPRVALERVREQVQSADSHVKSGAMREQGGAREGRRHRNAPTCAHQRSHRRDSDYAVPRAQRRSTSSIGEARPAGRVWPDN